MITANVCKFGVLVEDLSGETNQITKYPSSGDAKHFVQAQYRPASLKE
jgi:hypothetical protein